MRPSRSMPLKGPLSWTAARIASVDTSNAAGAAPAICSRHAISASTGKTSTHSGRAVKKISIDAAVSNANSRATSPVRGHVRRTLRTERSISRNGATTRTPIASPAHHTDHVGRKPLPWMAPDASNADEPIVALTSVLTSAAIRMDNASRNVVIASRKPTAFSRRHATSGASVLPTAISAAAHSGPPIVALTANAAIATAGHIWGPNVRNATTAMPVGGQNGVTLAPTSESLRLSRAVT